MALSLILGRLLAKVMIIVRIKMKWTLLKKISLMNGRSASFAANAIFLNLELQILPHITAHRFFHPLQNVIRGNFSTDVAPKCFNFNFYFFLFEFSVTFLRFDQIPRIFLDFFCLYFLP